MQLEALGIILPEIMCYCLILDSWLFKNKRVLNRLCLIEITTKYDVNVPKVFGLDMFYVSESIVNTI